MYFGHLGFHLAGWNRAKSRLDFSAVFTKPPLSTFCAVGRDGCITQDTAKFTSF